MLREESKILLDKAITFETLTERFYGDRFHSDYEAYGLISAQMDFIKGEMDCLFQNIKKVVDCIEYNEYIDKLNTLSAMELNARMLLEYALENLALIIKYANDGVEVENEN